MLCPFCGKERRESNRCPKCHKVQRQSCRGIVDPDFMYSFFSICEKNDEQANVDTMHDNLVDDNSAADSSPSTKARLLLRILRRKEH